MSINFKFRPNDLVLFQGDSVTDTVRNRDNPADLGGGYPNYTASWFNALYPDLNINFLNRGVGGDRTCNLIRRWQTDCIDLKPDWVSILIGINDTWRRYDSNDPTSVEQFEKNYREIIRLTLENTSAGLILCEPFLLPFENRMDWRVDLNPKIDVVRKLAREFSAIYVPFDGVMQAASTRREPSFWAADGVHPTNYGHALLAQTWLKAVGAL